MRNGKRNIMTVLEQKMVEDVKNIIIDSNYTAKTDQITLSDLKVTQDYV